MREVHERLVNGVRGEDKRPGEFRDRQNMIGRHGQSPREARFVPSPVDETPVDEMRVCLDALKRYIGKPSNPRSAHLPQVIEIKGVTKD